jgi:molybdopterin synthase sulfur carrier subunit
VIKVLFFARIREELDCPGLEVAWSDSVNDLDALQEQLFLERGERWREILTQHNIIRAVNQSVVEDGSPLKDGDEIAFFPPVTGG